MPSLPAPEDAHIQHRQQQQVCAVLCGLACMFKSIHRKLGLRNSTRTTSFHRGSGAANVASCSATARLLVRPGHLESQFIAGADRIWSRGRELNSRPADYESAALPLSYLGLEQKTTLASAENCCQFISESGVLSADRERRRNACADLNARTGTWPSRSRYRTAERAAATTQYILRDPSGGAGSRSRTRSISGARIAAWLASGSGETSSWVKPSGRARLHKRAALPAD